MLVCMKGSVVERHREEDHLDIFVIMVNTPPTTLRCLIQH